MCARVWVHKCVRVSVSACVCMRMCVCMSERVNARDCVCLPTCIHLCMRVYVCTCVRVRLLTRVCVFVCVCLRVYVRSCVCTIVCVPACVFEPAVVSSTLYVVNETMILTRQWYVHWAGRRHPCQAISVLPWDTRRWAMSCRQWWERATSTVAWVTPSARRTC